MGLPTSIWGSGDRAYHRPGPRDVPGYARLGQTEVPNFRVGKGEAALKLVTSSTFLRHSLRKSDKCRLRSLFSDTPPKLPLGAFGASKAPGRGRPSGLVVDRKMSPHQRAPPAVLPHRWPCDTCSQRSPCRFRHTKRVAWQTALRTRVVEEE